MRKQLMLWVFMVLQHQTLTDSYQSCRVGKSNMFDIKFSCSRLQHNDRRVGSHAESEIC